MKEKVRKVSFLRRTFLLSWEKGLSDSHMGNYFLNVGGGQNLGIGNARFGSDILISDKFF